MIEDICVLLSLDRDRLDLVIWTIFQRPSGKAGKFEKKFKKKLLYGIVSAKISEPRLDEKKRKISIF